MKELVKKYEEQLVYLVCGVTTTLINYAVFTLLSEVWHLEIVVTNVISFAVAVTVAFFTNKYFAFKSRDFRFKVAIKEYCSFVSLRLISMGIETLILFISVDLFNLNRYIVKICAAVLIIILNYIFAKFITFRKKVNS